MALDIQTLAQDGGRMCVAAVGEVDVSCASELRDALDQALGTEGVTQVDVDLADMSYIDSTGIGVLVGAAHRAREEEVVLAVRNPQRNVRRVFDMLGIAAELGLDDVKA